MRRIYSDTSETPSLGTWK